jgi:hypothetical protein
MYTDMIVLYRSHMPHSSSSSQLKIAQVNQSIRRSILFVPFEDCIQASTVMGKQNFNCDCYKPKNRDSAVGIPRGWRSSTGRVKNFQYSTSFTPVIWAYAASYAIIPRAHGSVIGWGAMLQAVRSRVRLWISLLDFSVHLIFPAALWPWGRLCL